MVLALSLKKLYAEEEQLIKCCIQFNTMACDVVGVDGGFFVAIFLIKS